MPNHQSVKWFMNEYPATNYNHLIMIKQPHNQRPPITSDVIVFIDDIENDKIIYILKKSADVDKFIALSFDYTYIYLFIFMILLAFSTRFAYTSYATPVVDPGKT